MTAEIKTLRKDSYKIDQTDYKEERDELMNQSWSKGGITTIIPALIKNLSGNYKELDANAFEI